MSKTQYAILRCDGSEVRRLWYLSKEQLKQHLAIKQSLEIGQPSYFADENAYLQEVVTWAMDPKNPIAHFCVYVTTDRDSITDVDMDSRKINVPVLGVLGDLDAIIAASIVPLDGSCRGGQHCTFSIHFQQFEEALSNIVHAVKKRESWLASSLEGVFSLIDQTIVSLLKENFSGKNSLRQSELDFLQKVLTVFVQAEVLLESDQLTVGENNVLSSHMERCRGQFNMRMALQGYEEQGMRILKTAIEKSFENIQVGVQR